MAENKRQESPDVDKLRAQKKGNHLGNIGLGGERKKKKKSAL